MICHRPVSHLRTILLAMLFAAGSLSTMAQEQQDSVVLAHPVTDPQAATQTPLLSIDHPILPAEYRSKLTLKELNKRPVSDALLQGFKPRPSVMRLSDEIHFEAERREYDAPLLHTRHAAGTFSWQPSDRMRFYTSGNFGLGHDLLTGIRKDYGWNAGADFRLSNSLTAHVQGGWQNNFGFMPMTSLGGHFRWQATDRLSFTTGINYRQVQWNAFDNKNLSIDGSMRYELIDRVYLNAFGSYPLYNNTRAGLNMAVPMYGFGPQYGGSLEVRMSDKFGFAFGAMQEYNIWTRRWETQYFAYPVFYNDKK